MSAPTKIALVTGAGSGLGRRTALALLRAGYAVVLAGRRRAALEATQAEAGPLGAHALVAPTDVSRPEAVATLFAQIRAVYGRLDLLFNNAGLTPPVAPIESVAFADWQTVVNINLTGAFLCLQAAFQLMKEQTPLGGRIINNGSISAHAPRPNFIAYTATKHAITGLTRATALEGRRYNIACGQIDIGNAATDMTHGMQAGALQADGSTAVEPTMDAEHVANAVVYMAGLPLDANVLFLTVMATQMPYVGRG